MSVSQDELDQAQDKLRDAFFALAFDSDSEEAAARADEALGDLDRLLEDADAPSSRAAMPRTASR